MADDRDVELVDTRIDGDRVEITLADDIGLTRLAGAAEQIAALCTAMEQAAVLAGASERPAWLCELRVGEDVVRLGIGHGRVRLLTGPAR
jgi:hypothetical protein